MRFAIFTILLLFSPPASADSSCFQSEPVVDRIDNWDFTNSARSDFYLPTRNHHGHYHTYAAAHLEWDGQIQVSFDHHLPSNMVGLPYTVHRLEIQIGKDEDIEKVVEIKDFTDDCKEAGLSFFPRQSSRLVPIKIPPRSDGHLRGKEPVRIRVWGHL